MDILDAPVTLCNMCSIFGKGYLFFLKILFRFLKSTHSLISPFFFLIGTRLATHSEYFKGTMIWVSNNFFTSLSIIGRNMGFICLNFCLNGLTSSFNGILCSMTFVSYVLRPSYIQANTSTNFFISLAYSDLCSLYRMLDNLTNFGSFSIPIFHSATSTSSFETLPFTTTSFLSNSLSRGTSPFGI
jgi:hypothetical protein